MVKSHKKAVAVKEEYQIAQARQTAIALARKLGFDRPDAHAIATSVSELASNLFFHGAKSGVIELSELKKAGKIGLKVLSRDSGPGIPDLELAMQDGFSTNRGLGGGLPGVERLMDEFEIESEVKVGTTVMAIKWKKPKKWNK